MLLCRLICSRVGSIPRYLSCSGPYVCIESDQEKRYLDFESPFFRGGKANVEEGSSFALESGTMCFPERKIVGKSRLAQCLDCFNDFIEGIMRTSRLGMHA